jgi:4-diphosphocytidyl-2-C-methyl-D-erythritol kinase
MILNTNVKLNLGLNVLRKRPDGYHDIETLFVPYLEMGDILEVITGDDYSRTSAALFGKYGDSVVQGISGDGKLMVTIASEDAIGWDPMEDLCAKAYQALAKDFDMPPVKIFLEKKVPVGAGLGGGSADAAFTLKALNEVCRLGLTDERLAAYASSLGSDCAFFIWNRPMLGEGRGEVLTPFGGLPAGYRIEVEVPAGIAVSTAEAYRGIRPRENADRPMPLRQVLARPVEEWKDLLVNDFEETVFAAHPQLAERKRQLYARGAVYAAMSGSGSALFGIFKEV